MWQLPQTLELLSFNKKKITNFDPMVCKSLHNLKMIDIFNNELESLQGAEHFTRLKRLICKNSNVSDLTPITDLTMLIEIDLLNSKVHQDILATIVTKKDILVLNLKFSPCV